MSLLQPAHMKAGRHSELGSFLEYLENGGADSDESIGGKNPNGEEDMIFRQTGYTNSYHLGNRRVQNDNTEYKDSHESSKKNRTT